MPKTPKFSPVPSEPGYLQRLVRRVSVKIFDDYNWTLIPTVIVGHEPSAWGCPEGRWAAFVWLKWNLQIALHDWPREGCLFLNRWNPPPTEPNNSLEQRAKDAGQKP